MHLDLTEPKVSSWINSLTQAHCTINAITPLSVQTKQNGELLFAYLNADVTAPEGYKLLPIIFLRGDAVVVVPEITNSDTGEKKFLMVEQRRIASGELHLEFPAGMLDRDINNPAKVVLKELYEETGLQIAEAELHLLHDRALFSSPGASDEKIWFFGARVALSDSEFRTLHGRITGAHDENEHIRTVLACKNDFLERNESAQAMLAYQLFQK